MNCKKGDLAIVVSSCIQNSPNIGKVVRCVEFVPALSMISPGSIVASDGWITDTPLEIYSESNEETKEVANFATDKFLRPLRENDQEDETLTWAGKPEKATA